MSDKFPEEHLQHYPLLISPLPSGWSFVSLADIARDINPGFASGRHSSDGSGTSHLRPMNIDRDGNINLNVLKSVASTHGVELAAGDVLFNNTNSAELVGKTALISSQEQGYTFSNHMTRICLEAGIKAGFIARQLHFLWKSGFSRHRCTNHVNQASISSKTLANTMPLLLPPPREQERIIDKLEELLGDLDAGVAELKAAQKKLLQYRQSLLKAAVDGSLTAEWREAQSQQPGEPKETGAQLLKRILTERRARWEARQLLKFRHKGKEPPTGWKLKYSEQKKSVGLHSWDIPDTWVWATVEQLGQVQLGRQRSPSKMKGECPVKYIRAANITENGIDFSDVLEMDFTETERETFHLQCGDILLTEASGSAEHVGRPAIWPAVDGVYCFQNTVIRFRPLGITSIFAYYIFLSFQKLGIFQQLSGGVGINHLSAGKFSALAVPLPPIAEQEAIVEALESAFAVLDKQSAAISHSLKQSAAQRQNILKAAFSGQLVPQDPNDEPASVLLERIRTERAAADTGRGKRGRKSRVLP